MEVALISHEFPPFAGGGVGTFCNALARSLAAKGISTTVFCGKSMRTVVTKVAPNLTIVRLPLLDIPPRSLWFQILNRNIWKLFNNISILHGIYPQVGLITAYLKQRLGIPVVTSVHGVPQFELQASLQSPVSYWTIGDIGFHLLELPIYHWLANLGLAVSDSIVTCSFNTRREIVKIYPNITSTINVIYNGIKLEYINQLTTTSTLSTSSSPSIIFYGRLYYIKGLIHLISAIAHVVREIPNITLHIYGKGPLEPRIRRLTHKLELTNHVILHGHIPNKQLIQRIHASTCVVLPSLYEAQPISVLEAMACKKAVIAFNYPFSREVVKDNVNGMLARAGDSEDLGDKIQLLITDHALRQRLEQNAYEYVATHHNWDYLVNDYIKVYYDTIANHR